MSILDCSKVLTKFIEYYNLMILFWITSNTQSAYFISSTIQEWHTAISLVWGVSSMKYLFGSYDVNWAKMWTAQLHIQSKYYILVDAKKRKKEALSNYGFFFLNLSKAKRFSSPKLIIVTGGSSNYKGPYFCVYIFFYKYITKDQ